MCCLMSTGKTILVVEDRNSSLKLFQDLLDNKGYAVVPITDGSLVEDAVLRHRPDLIVMDIQLPGKSGLDIIPALKIHPDTRSIPILAVSAFTMEGDVARIMASGPDAFMTKPFNILDFLKKVAELLASSDSVKKAV